MTKKEEKEMIQNEGLGGLFLFCLLAGAVVSAPFIFVMCEIINFIL